MKTFLIRLSIFAIACFCSCDMLSPRQNSTTGSVAPQILFASAAADPDVSFSPIIKGWIDTVEIQINHGEGTAVQRFPYEDHSGIVEGLPPGEADVIIIAQNANGNEIVQGQTTVRIEPGKTSQPPVVVGPSNPQAPLLGKVELLGNEPRIFWHLWNAIKDDAQYSTVVIFRADNKDGPFDEISSVDIGQSAYTDNTAPMGQTVWYRIAARGTDNTGEWSNKTGIFIPNDQSGTSDALPTIDDVRLQNTNVIIEWSFPQSDEDQISHFRIKRGLVILANNYPKDQRAFTDTQPLRGIRSDYKVCAIYLDNAEECSDPVGFDVPE